MTFSLLLCSLLPDVLHAIVGLSCSDMHSTDVCRRCSSCSRHCHSTAPDMPHPQSGCQCHCRRVGHPCQLFSRHCTGSSVVSRFAACSGPFTTATPSSNVASSWHRAVTVTPIYILPPAGLRKIHLWVPAGASTMRIMHQHMPCLTDLRCDSSAPAGVHAETSLSTPTQSRDVRTGVCRLTSYKVLKGLDWLDLQQVAAQLTSLSLSYSSTVPATYLDRQGDAQMLAGLAQLSELRHLDCGKCQFMPAPGTLCIWLAVLLCPLSLLLWRLRAHLQLVNGPQLLK
jgi:hypothetical protein